MSFSADTEHNELRQGINDLQRQIDVNGREILELKTRIQRITEIASGIVWRSRLQIIAIFLCFLFTVAGSLCYQMKTLNRRIGTTAPKSVESTESNLDKVNATPDAIRNGK